MPGRRFGGTFTNLLNHPNFAPPPTKVTASSFGQVQSVQRKVFRTQRTAETEPADFHCGLTFSSLLKRLDFREMFSYNTRAPDLDQTLRETNPG